MSEGKGSTGNVIAAIASPDKSVTEHPDEHCLTRAGSTVCCHPAIAAGNRIGPAPAAETTGGSAVRQLWRITKINILRA